jgi:hypothetical protein
MVGATLAVALAPSLSIPPETIRRITRRANLNAFRNFCREAVETGKFQ